MNFPEFRGKNKYRTVKVQLSQVRSLHLRPLGYADYFEMVPDWEMIIDVHKGYYIGLSAKLENITLTPNLAPNMIQIVSVITPTSCL